MYKKFCIALIPLVIFFSGCNQGKDSSISENDEVKFSKKYLVLFQNRNYEEIKRYLNTQMLNQHLQSELELKTKYFPNEQPKSITLVGSKVLNIYFLNSENYLKENLTFQYEFADSWLIVDIVLEKRVNSDYIVDSVNVTPMTDSLENINKFSMDDISTIHYIIIFSASIITLFVFKITLVVCIRTPIKKKKWLWIIFILLGIGTISFNWTSGEIYFQFISFQLFGSGFTRASIFEPWIISVSFPIGAIVFWNKKSKLNQSNINNENKNTENIEKEK